uniref:Uncharacterized protein n=1 Tax=Oryza brachyantha TaxID=4533 RepID=J3L9U5_ORYBR
MELTIKKKTELEKESSDNAKASTEDNECKQSVEEDNANDRTIANIMKYWRIPFIKFLTEEELPTEKAEAERIKCQSYYYFVSNGELL